VPAIEGLARVGCLTNETVFSLTHQPRRLAVIGAGPIGCEMAQAFCRLGSEVTLIERESQILPGEDPDACRILASALQRDDMAVKLGAIVTHVRGGKSLKTVHLRAGPHSEQVTVDEILVCVGRTPSIAELGLPAAGIEQHPEHGIVIDDHLRTTNPRVYAAGDVCTRYRFAHVADAMARIAVRNALFLGRGRFSNLIIPRCIYTDPEIARVGIGCDEARQRGWLLDTFSVPFHTIDRAVIDGDEEGLLKIHVHKGNDKILGATIIGRRAGDMISEITLAMVHHIGLKGIAEVIYPYPTHIEAIRKAADACTRASLRPTTRRLWRRWLAWSR
jgi:pyruvate/2-oxoglutarate dehydrogenase complex dihydrolipoamide dehydrogenase (E3) component